MPLLVLPSDPRIVFAGTLNRGLFRSTGLRRRNVALLLQGQFWDSGDCPSGLQGSPDEVLILAGDTFPKYIPLPSAPALQLSDRTPVHWSIRHPLHFSGGNV